MPRFGIQIGDFGAAPPKDLFPRTVEVARAAEAHGFETLWVMDHFHQLEGFIPRGDPMPEGYVILAALAAVTERIELGTLVTGALYRNPAHLGKIVTTLDVVSGGRAILGVGAGWHEDEIRAYGFADALPPVRERLDRLEDALRICRAMFAEPESSVTGVHSATSGALNVPRPVRPGGPPIMVGGGGEKRLLRLVAQYADMCNLFGDADVMRHKNAVIDRHCADVGRDPRAVERTRLAGLVIAPTMQEALADAERVKREKGIHPDLFASSFHVGTPESIREECAALLDAGLDQLMFFAGPWTPEGVALAAEALAPLR